MAETGVVDWKELARHLSEELIMCMHHAECGCRHCGKIMDAANEFDEMERREKISAELPR